MKRRILSIFMCLCMALCLLPTAALADGVTEYNVWVGGVRITSDNASSVTGPGITGTVSYHAESNTLTLSGASVTGAYTDNSYSAAIYASTDLAVVLSGVNTVVGTASRYSFGVYCTGALTIEGNGSLNAVGGEEAESTGESIGIYGKSSVTISGSARVAATGGKSGAGSIGVFGDHGVNISDATVTAIGGEAGGISCGVWGCSANVGVSVSGSAKVTAIEGNAGNCSYGVFGDCSSIDISGTATVTATSGEAGNSSYGVYVLGAINVNNLTGEGAANNGLLIAKSGSATTSNSTNTAPTCGDGSAALTGAAVNKFAVWGETGKYYVLNSTLDLSTWSDGSTYWNDTTGGYKTETAAEGVKTLTLKNVIINVPDADSGDVYGIKLPNADVTIMLEGTNVVSAGDASSGYSYGVCGFDISTFEGGNINISGGGALYTLSGSAGGCSFGVLGTNISVSDGAAVTAMGGWASGDPGSSYGVFSDGTISVTDGTVTAAGGAASGIMSNSYSVSGDTISVTDGALTATGGTVNGASGSSCGVYGGNDVSVSGGVVTATGGAASGSCGVYGGSTVTLSGTVTATGGTADYISYGVSGGDGGIILSGTVITTGGTAGRNSYGVCSDGGTIFVTSGTATALSGTVGSSGSSQAMNKAPDLTGYTSNHSIIVSANADGSSPASYAADNIATYKYLKIGTLYALTGNLNGGSGATTSSNYMVGDVVSIDAGTKSGYTFSGWTATGGGTFANASSASTTYTMPACAAAITANWTANSSGGGDSGTSTTTVPVSGGSGAVNLSAFISGNTATVSATDAQLQKITSGTETGTVKIDASGLKVNTVVVPSKLVTVLDDASGSTGLDIALPTGTVTLDKPALASAVGKGDIKLSVKTVANSSLTDTQRGVLGAQAETALVVDVNVYVNGTKTSTFGDGKISVSVPYTPKSGESANSITVWFVGDDGTIEPKNGVYNAATSCVEFTTEHLSQYLIVSFPFADVAENSWYYGSVAYAYNNGLFAGKSDTVFSPDTVMTRQMIWMVLARMDGKTPTDMNAARAWAMENGISDGSNPTSSITREQMAAILYRYAQYKGCDVSIGEETNILSYDDALTISEYAIPAIQWTCGAGLMQGSKNNNIMPFRSATRAQVATILQRFCQNVVK